MALQPTEEGSIVTPPDEPRCTSKDWNAIHDHMPGPNKEWATTVSGVVTAPTSGWSVDLRKHEPQGINPWDLLLDLICTPPADSANDVLEDHNVEFVGPGEYEYLTVTVIGHQVIEVQHPQ
jgi:hypothetical protein